MLKVTLLMMVLVVLVILLWIEAIKACRDSFLYIRQELAKITNAKKELLKSLDKSKK